MGGWVGGLFTDLVVRIENVGDEKADGGQGPAHRGLKDEDQALVHIGRGLAGTVRLEQGVSFLYE